MGEYIGTVRINPTPSGTKMKKAGKAAGKGPRGPKHVHIAGSANRKRIQALVKDLKRLAAKYRFKVMET